MYFLFLTFAVSVAAIALDSAKRPSDLTNLDSGRAVPVLEGSMGTATQGTLLSETHVQRLIHPSRSRRYGTSDRSSRSATESESKSKFDSDFRSDNPTYLQRGALPRVSRGNM